MILDARAVADTTDDDAWTPVAVTAVLAEPVVNLIGHAAHLDGPASWGAYLAHLDEAGHGELPPMTANQVADFPLPMATWTAPAPGQVHPLATTGDPRAVWGWACSRAHYTTLGHTTVQVRRRPAIDEGARYATTPKWHLSAGPTKARDVPHGAVIAREITWHALAAPAALQALLDRVGSLGRLTRHGHGKILAWTVTPDPDARDGWRDRVWPDPSGAPGTIRAPYHHPSRRMPCTL